VNDLRHSRVVGRRRELEGGVHALVFFLFFDTTHAERAEKECSAKASLYTIHLLSLDTNTSTTTTTPPTTTPDRDPIKCPRHQH
jgi:hypothetical protein